MFEEIFSSISELDSNWLYGILLLAAYTENIIPPIPGDSVVIFGAYLVGLGKIDFLPSLIITTVGSVAGFMSFYAIGRFSGREFFHKKSYKWFNEERINKVDSWFQRRGYTIIAANRFLAGTRSVVSIFAGITRLNWIKVIVLATLSSLTWNGLLISAGYFAGKNWKYVERMLQNYNIFITALILIGVAAGIFFYKKRNKSVRLSEGN